MDGSSKRCAGGVILSEAARPASWGSSTVRPTWAGGRGTHPARLHRTLITTACRTGGRWAAGWTRRTAATDPRTGGTGTVIWSITSTSWRRRRRGSDAAETGHFLRVRHLRDRGRGAGGSGAGGA